MPRIPDVDPSSADGYVTKVLDAQARTWGSPLLNHLVYARRPALFRAVRGMWGAVNKDAILDPALVHLINRRVATLNGCAF